MSVPLEGGCACGAVRYRLTSEPLFTHCCHCLNCQRQTGSAFVINLLIETDRVELLAGDPQAVEVPRDGGRKQKIWRCPTARWRSTASTHARRCDSSAPARSTIRRESLPTCTSSRDRSCRWVVLPDSVPAFDVYYDMRSLWPAASLERAKAAMAPAKLRRLRPALGALRWLDDSELRIGLGCMRLSTGDHPERRAATIAAAAEAGIIVFDTARAYGDNETLLARALRACGAHERARIVTKGGMTGALGSRRPSEVDSRRLRGQSRRARRPADRSLSPARTGSAHAVAHVGAHARAARRRGSRPQCRSLERQPSAARRSARARTGRGCPGRAQPVRRRRAARGRRRPVCGGGDCSDGALAPRRPRRAGRVGESRSSSARLRRVARLPRRWRSRGFSGSRPLSSRFPARAGRRPHAPRLGLQHSPSTPMPQPRSPAPSGVPASLVHGREPVRRSLS